MEEGLFASFPHQPYDIQKKFMLNAYDTLEQRQIGLFESPTGTGKTLSVICSTLKWLEDHRQQQQEAATAAAAAAGDSALPSWLTATTDPAQPEASRQRTQRQQHHRKKRLAKPVLFDEDGNDLSDFLLDSCTTSNTAAAASDGPSPGTKRGLQPSHQSSDSDEGSNGAAATGAGGDGTAGGEAAAADAAAERRKPQVIFCSRTHSQLSQFVGELHRTRFADSTQLVAVASRKALCVNEQVRQLPELSQVSERCLELQRSKATSNSSRKRSTGSTPPGAHGGSRSSSSVQGLAGTGTQQRQQRQRKPRAAGCPYLSPPGGAGVWGDFTEMVLAAPIDVEELANLGRKQQVCPYYGSRRAVPSADVVLAPYSAVLMPDARDSLGIELQDSVLVFDEAHNLLDAINSAHSTAVSAWQLLSVQRSLSAYYERFKAFLNPVNAQHLQQLVRIAAALHGCLQQQQQHQPFHGSSGGSSVMNVNDLLFDLGLDNINMFQLARWVRDNKMAFKVSGYTAAAVAKAGGPVGLQQAQQPASTAATQPAVKAAADVTTTSDQQPPQQQQQLGQLGQLSAKDGVSAIHSFVSFLLALTNLDADGRIIVDPPGPAGAASASAPSTSTTAAAGALASNTQQQHVQRQQQAARGGRLRYVLLNAARHFGALLASARSVLLVSGTLAPVDGLRAQLFPDLPPSRIRHFECGHVVPANQLLAVSVGRGPSGRVLCLKHEQRDDAGTMDELGLLLLNLCGVVPEGLVVFVPSFGYLDALVGHWQASGLWGRLAHRKQVFREPRAATEVEQVLEAYAAAIAGTSSQPAAAAAAAAAQCSPPTSKEHASTINSGNSGAGGSTQVSASVAGAGGGAGGGALMLCVVGAKLSEGINFGDGLGRGVVVVGLPYPNRTDLELQERMKYLDSVAATAAAARTASAPATGAQQQQDTPTQEQEQDQQQQQQPQLATATGVQRSAFHIISHHRGSSTSHGSKPTGATQPMISLHTANPAAACMAAPAAPPAGVAPQDSPHAAGASSSGGGSGGGNKGSSDGSNGGSSGDSSGGGASLLTGQAYYSDLCFKAVNQCVGRVVRHGGDYAAVVLLDTRWVASPAEWASASAQHSANNSHHSSRKVPVQQLPGWLQRSYVPSDGSFGPAFKQLAAFYKQQYKQADCGRLTLLSSNA